MSTAARPAAVVILHGVTAPDPAPDDVDTLLQAQAIASALRNDGLTVRELAVGLDLQALDTLATEPPPLVFNLVESLAGRGALAHLPASVLEARGIRFTGSPARTLAITTDKPLGKKLLRAAGLPTPDAWEHTAPPDEQLVIVKPSCEDGSVGITAASVMRGADYLSAMQRQPATVLFAEAYIEGREFNVSLLAAPDGRAVEVLPVAEIRFIDFPADRPRILDYEAKWAPDSVAYRGTVRHTLAPGEEPELTRRLSDIARRVWTLFELRGYARVDFRVDVHGQPWIVDINANPCLAPDAGFVAAATAAGLSFADVIRRIVAAAQVTGARADSPAANPCTAPANSTQRRWRSTVEPRDIAAVHALVARTGVFSDEEQAVAAELVETTLQQGPAAGYEFIFAETGDKLEGYACFGPIPGAPGRYDLYWIAVCPDTRRQGLGREVLTRAERQMRASGASRVYLDTAGRAAYRPTHAFYFSCGYRTIAELKDYYAPGDDKLIMMKELTNTPQR